MTLNCSRRVTQGTVKNSLFLFVAFMKGLSFRDFVAQCGTGLFRLSLAKCFVQLLALKEKGREMYTLPSRLGGGSGIIGSLLFIIPFNFS